MRRIITLLTILLLWHEGAMAQVTAQFTPSLLFGCPPLVVSFTNQSTGATTYNWEFDNSNTSTLANPTATFSQPGIYNVLLTACNGSQCDTQTQQIRVFQPAAPNFTAANSTNGCASPCHTVNFINQTIPGESPVAEYVWDFGDGSLPQSGYNVSHCFPNIGTFAITLIARDQNGCQTSRTIPNFVTIGPGPTATLTANPSQSCTAPLNVSFTGAGSSPNGAVSFAWFFGDGNTSALQNPNNSYANGIWNPILIVTDAFGCQATDTGLVEVTVMQADFAVESNSGCVGLPIQFYDSSNYATSWSWDFGDGGTSTLQNPTHSYSAPGNYTVSLTATYNNCSNTYTQLVPINITTPINYTFAANDTSSCSAPLSVNFTNTAVGGVSYMWYFGDGDSSSLANPSHTYSTPGNYTVSLSIANGQGCTNVVTQTNYIGVGQINAAFTVDSFEGCTPMLVRFTNNSSSDVPIVSYQWNFGDNSPVAGGANPQHNYTVSGTYQPTLVITDASGCVDSAVLSDDIVVGNALIPDFVGDPLVQCVNQPVSFTNNTQGFDNNTLWLWEFGDGVNSTLQNPIHAYSDTGIYTITLTVINEGCRTDTQRVDYVLIVVPKAQFYFNYDCTLPTTIQFRDTSQGAETWFWDFGDGTTSTQQNPVHVFPSTDLYEITLVVTNATTGCVDSMKQSIPVGSAGTDFSADTTAGCTSFAVSFTDESALAQSWRWEFGDGSFATTQNPVHTYTLPGSYDVTLITNPAGQCPDTLVKTAYITAYGVIANIVRTPGIGCDPLTVSFSDTSKSYLGTIVKWSWDFGNGDVDSVATTTYTYTPSGVYVPVLTVTDSRGCTDAATSSVTVQRPDAFFTVDSIACPGESLQFTNVTPTNGAFWDFGDGTTSTLQNPSHAYAASGSYTVTLIVYTYPLQCPDTFTLVNAVNVDTPSADFYVLTNFAPCPPFPVQFFNSTNRTDLMWEWHFGDGDTSTAFQPLHVYFMPGDYDVTLIAYDSSGCRDTTTYIDMIRVRGPIGNFTATPDSGCVPLTISISGTTQSTVSSTLDLGDGIVLNDTVNLNHTYTQVGNYYPVFTLTDSVGCVVSYPVDTIVVGLIPYPNLPADTTVCKGNYVGLTSQYGDHFVWTSSPSPTYLNCDTCKSVICSAPDTLTLYVTATTNIGCVASDTVRINVDKLPPIFPGVSFRICLGDTLQLTAGPNVTAATWTPNLFIDDTNSVNPKVFPPDSAVYRVTGGNSTGCTISRQVRVYVIDKVEAELNITDTLLCEAGVLPLDLSVSQASYNDTSYFWSPATYLNASNIQDPVVAPPPGDYTYTVIVRSSTCIPDTETLHLIIAPNPVVQAGDDQTVTPGTRIQLYASSPDDVSYLWTPVDSMNCVNCRRPYLTATQNQIVYVTATNQYGCPGVDSVKIRVIDCDPESIYIPNTFTPNGDGLNDVLLVRGIGLRKLDFFRVYDRWGKLVFETANLNDGWDGNGPYGKSADVATYVYVVSGTCSNGSSIQKSGNVTLVR